MATVRPTPESLLDEIAPRIAWEQYLRSTDPEGLRLEYDLGRVLVSPTGTNAHDLFRDLLLTELVAWRRTRPRGSALVVSEHSFFMPAGERDLRPDLAVVVDDRARGPLDPRGWIEGAPTIAIEVLSPSTEPRDRGLKARRYLEQGTREYWIVDPLGRTAQIYRSGGSGWEEVTPAEPRYTTALLPGFVLDLTALWRELDQLLGP